MPEMAILTLIQVVAQDLGLEPELLQAVVQVESGYDPGCISNLDYGLMQVNLGTLRAMPEPWRSLEPRELLKPQVGLDAGGRILRWYLVLALRDEMQVAVRSQDVQDMLLRLSPMDRQAVISRALAYYNGGEHVGRDETGRWANQDYVDAVLAEYDRLLRGEADGSGREQ